jgi:hypothetical protein
MPLTRRLRSSDRRWMPHFTAQRRSAAVAAAERRLSACAMQVSDRMDVIEGSTWSGKLTSKFLTATERLKIAPDVGVLFALSTASKTVTSDTVSELQADPYLCHLALSHQPDNVFAPNAAMPSSVFDTDCFSRRLRSQNAFARRTAALRLSSSRIRHSKCAELSRCHRRWRSMAV